MTPERKAEYHRTIDLLRRCAQGQPPDIPATTVWMNARDLEAEYPTRCQQLHPGDGQPVGLVPLDGEEIDGPIVDLISDGPNLYIYTERSVYAARLIDPADPSRMETQKVADRFYGTSVIDHLVNHEARPICDP